MSESTCRFCDGELRADSQRCVRYGHKQPTSTPMERVECGSEAGPMTAARLLELEGEYPLNPELDSYALDDRDKHLGPRPWHDSPELRAWEEAHSHDVRLKCYAEFGCRLVEETHARIVRALLADVLWWRQTALTLINAHEKLHCSYPTTAACHGGIGGMAITSHCAVICDNLTHEPDRQAWEDVMRAAMRALCA